MVVVSFMLSFKLMQRKQPMLQGLKEARTNIGRPYPWVSGGHGCEIIVHGWTWVGMNAKLLGMGGHGCNLKGKCRSLQGRLG